jgi:hypothetical protein
MGVKLGSLILREGCRLKVRRTPDNKELHNFNSLPNITGMIKPRRMR